MKNMLKSVSIIMAFCMIMCTFPIYTLAEDEVDNTEVKTEEQPATALYEIESLREESIKHFKMSDGTYTAVKYSDPVHYKENGEWKEIDMI